MSYHQIVDESKTILEQSAYLDVERVFDANHDELLAPESKKTNVVGVGIGVKYTNGQPTGKPAVVVLVDQKVPRDYLSKDERIPEKLGEIQTDVVEVGILQAANQLMVPASVGALPYGRSIGAEVPTELYLREDSLRHELPLRRQALDTQVLTNRVRPALGGYSVGHYKITAGTLGTVVYDSLPNGIGVPPRFYILSNNHVLANSNDAVVGDPILQPGPIDGGVLPQDFIAKLSKFVPIQFAPAIPLALQNNIVDAAIAEGNFQEISREIYAIGYLRGWTPKACVKTGLRVKKTGRTTNLTFGRITTIKATVDVNYGAGRTARFKDQILTTNMSMGGDSGSLLTNMDNVAVGLLFAGSAQVTVFNYIENVRNLLKVEVADQMLLI